VADILNDLNDLIGGGPDACSEVEAVIGVPLVDATVGEASVDV
jgi:hypothetical protein